MSTRPDGGLTDKAYEELVDLAQRWLVAEANDDPGLGSRPTVSVEDPTHRAEVDAWKHDVEPRLVRRNGTISAVLCLGFAVLAFVSLNYVTVIAGLVAAGFGLHVVASLIGLALPHGAPHNGRPDHYSVLPEIKSVVDLMRAAPQRLTELHASPHVIAQVEAARAVVERELPRLGQHQPWTFIGNNRPGAKNGYAPTSRTATPYTRIMRAGAETVLVLRLAEEKEHALTTGGSAYGPWGTRSLIAAVRELVDETALVRDMDPTIDELGRRIDAAADQTEWGDE